MGPQWDVPSEYKIDVQGRVEKGWLWVYKVDFCRIRKSDRNPIIYNYISHNHH